MVDRSRSHRVTLALVTGAPGVVVKQVDPLAAAAGRELWREAVVHELAVDRSPLAAALPALRHWDPERGLLVLDLVRPGETLSARALRLGAPEPLLASALGAMLAGIHRSTAGRVATAALGSDPPWALTVFERDRVEWVWEDPGMRAVLAAVPQAGAVAAALRTAAEHWHERCLVHGDIRAENCLVDETGTGAPTLKLVDWELACKGDPAWDVACGLAELASPLGGTHVARRALWEAYLGAAHLMPGPAERFASRAVLYAGARLLQSALEYGRRDGPGAEPVPSLLQQAAVTLATPGEQLPPLLGGAPVPSRERPGDCIPCAQRAA
jgi:hypothetical protein